MLIASLPAIAFASITPSQFVPGIINRLEDDDFEGGILAGSTLEEGDILFGSLKIQALYAPPANIISNDSTTTLTAMFALEVDVKGGAVGAFTYDFKPVSVATWALIFDAPNSVRNDPNTILMLFQNSNDPAYVDDIDPNSGSDYGAATYLAEFGFLGADPTDPTLGFWHAETPTDDPLAIPTNSGDLAVGLFLLDNAMSVGLELHDALDFTNTMFGGTDVSYHIEAAGNFWTNQFPSDPDSMPLISDGDFFILPAVPEPVSAIVWLGLTSLLVGAFGRRRAT
jgi:hypothetical protein